MTPLPDYRFIDRGGDQYVHNNVETDFRAEQLGAKVEVVDQAPIGLSLVSVPLYNATSFEVLSSVGLPITVTPLSGAPLGPQLYYSFVDVSVARDIWISSEVLTIVSYAATGTPTAVPIVSWNDPWNRIRKISGLVGATVRIQTGGYGLVNIWSSVRTQLSGTTVFVP